jgi:hypothetical protein
MVLASMAGVLAVTALALQLARGESTAVDPGALMLPFVLTLPVLALTAAAAVLFETIPVLRVGLGNIAWFFLWMITAIAGQGAPLGGPGTHSDIDARPVHPSLALMLGTASRTHRMFQAIYVILWYAAVNQVAAADYMGTVLVNGRPGHPPC